MAWSFGIVWDALKRLFVWPALLVEIASWLEVWNTLKPPLVRFVRTFPKRSFLWLVRTFPIASSILAIIIISLLFIPIGLYLFGPEATGRLAGVILSKSEAPKNREYPPVASAVPFSAGNIQILGGMGKGLSCSLPSWADPFTFKNSTTQGGEKPAPVSLQMKQACAYHDYCYRHGAKTYGYSQQYCDYKLLEHAYRLCKQIYSDPQVCIPRAQKVLLGTRMFGSTSFHGNEDGSTYFEFDPYPTSPFYTVYRLADTPSGWKDKAHPKSLYVFEIKPTAMRMHIVGFGKDDSGEKYCASLELPGNFNYLQTAPQIASVEKDKKPEDWFVWWRRYSLDKTGGDFALLRPGSAGLEDWKEIFPGAREPVPDKDCNSGIKAWSEDISGSTERNFAIIKAGSYNEKTDKGPKDDNNFSEFHTIPGHINDAGQIELFSLRTNGCQKADENEQDNNSGPLCYLPIRLGLQKIQAGPAKDNENEFQRQIPTVLRDRLSGYGKTKQDRYRNFILPPLITKKGNEFIFSVFRRGDAEGNDYENTIHLRRFRTEWTTSKDDTPDTRAVGQRTVLINGFFEENEPPFVVGRALDRPFLSAIVAEKKRFCGWPLIDGWFCKSAVKLRWWHMPDYEDDTCCNPKPNAILKAEDKREEVIAGLDPDWLKRPPLLISNSKDEVALLFTKEKEVKEQAESSPSQKGKDAVPQEIEIKWLSISVESGNVLRFGDTVVTRATDGVSVKSRDQVLPLKLNGKIALIAPDSEKPFKSELRRTQIPWPE